MNGVILASGYGTRLGEIGRAVPKFLLPAFGTTVADYLLCGLKKSGINETIINASHGAGEIARYVGNGSRWGMSVLVSSEPSPIGSAKTIFGLAPWLTDPFFVLYGDTVSRFHFHGMFSRMDDADAVIATCDSHDCGAGGYASVSENGQVLGFMEVIDSVGDGFNSRFVGGMIIRKECLCPRASDIGGDLIPGMVQIGKNVVTYPVARDCAIDIGTLEGLRKVNG
jgi:NDP-sugar pyrophosphorylase family protein